jgi:hypothetical protein
MGLCLAAGLLVVEGYSLLYHGTPLIIHLFLVFGFELYMSLVVINLMSNEQRTILRFYRAVKHVLGTIYHAISRYSICTVSVSFSLPQMYLSDLKSV